MSKHTKKVNKTKSLHHKKIVGGLLAAAFAFAVMVGVQVSEINSSQLTANMTCWDGSSVPDGGTCPVNNGGTTTTPSTMSCNSAGGTMMTPAECDAVDARRTSCTSTTPPGTWSTSGGGTCTAAVVAPTCTAPQYLNTQTNTCVTPPPPTCTAPMVLDSATNTCVNNTTTCPSGQYWSGTACVNNTTSSCPADRPIMCGGGTCAATMAACPASTTTGTSGNMPTIYTSWNNLGLSSMICTTASPAAVAAAKAACANTPMGQSGLWSTGANHGDCTANPNAGIPSCSGSATTNTSTTCAYGMYFIDGMCKADTVDNCKNRGGQWNPSGGNGNGQCTITPVGVSVYPATNTSTTGSNTKAGCEQSRGFWVEGTVDQNFKNGYCKWDTNTQDWNKNTMPVPTVDSCKRDGGTWNAGSSTCTWGNYRTKDNWEGECISGGGTWKTGGGTPTAPTDGWCEGGQTKYVQPPMPMPYPMPNQAMDCGQGMYYDFKYNSCQANYQPVNPMDWNQNFTGNFTCPAWDTMCGQFKNDGNFMDGQFDVNAYFNTDQAQCMGARDAKGAYKARKMELKNFDAELLSMDFSTLTKSATIAAALASLEEAKNIANQIDPINPDGCEVARFDSIIGQLHSPESGFFDAMNQARQQADWNRQLSDFRREFDDIAKRLTFMNLDKKDLAKVSAIQARGLAKITELEVTPPVDEWGNIDWNSTEPECMQQRGFGGGRFGGQQQGCTYDEAVASDTVRGYTQAIYMLLENLEYSQFKNNMCEDAAMHFGQFEQMITGVADQLDDRGRAEAANLLRDGNKAVEVCKTIIESSETIEDNRELMSMFDNLRVRAEKLMRNLDLGDEFDGLSDEFGGVQYLVSEETLNGTTDLQAYIDQEIKKGVREGIAKGLAEIKAKFTDQISSLAGLGMSDETISGLTSILNGLVGDENNEEIINGLTANTAIFSALPEESSEARESQQELLVDNLGDLSTLESLSPEAEAAVDDARRLLTDYPLTPERLENAGEIIEDALAYARNGGENVAEILEGVREAVVASEDPVENRRVLNTELGEEGLSGGHIDVDLTAWYGAEVVAFDTRANSVSGTTDANGDTYFRAADGGNCAESITFIAKSLGVEPGVAGAEAKAISGGVTWFEPYAEAMINLVGESEVKLALKDCGSVGGAIHRDAITRLGVEAYEAITGEEIQVDADKELVNYTDNLSAENKEYFARAHAIGFVTGANGGTEAQADGLADRAQIAKMTNDLAEATDQALLISGGLGTSDFPTPPTALPQPTGN